MDPVELLIASLAPDPWVFCGSVCLDFNFNFTLLSLNKIRNKNL
jgi:hypothetical protein